MAAWIAPTSKAGVPVAVTPKPTSERTDLYVCTGCGIGEAVDADRLAALGNTELKHPGTVAGPLCIPEGLAALRDGLVGSEADRVVIAACSERVNHDVFSPASAMFKATPPTTSVTQREATKKPAYQTGIPRQGGDVMPSQKEPRPS